MSVEKALKSALPNIKFKEPKTYENFFKNRCFSIADFSQLPITDVNAPASCFLSSLLFVCKSSLKRLCTSQTQQLAYLHTQHYTVLASAGLD